MHVVERTFDQQRDPSIYDEFFFFPEHKLSITPQNKNVVSKRSSKKISQILCATHCRYPPSKLKEE